MEDKYHNSERKVDNLLNLIMDSNKISIDEPDIQPSVTACKEKLMSE